MILFFSERIVASKLSKAGHLSEITKIFCKLDGYLRDYKFSVEVGSEAKTCQDGLI